MGWTHPARVPAPPAADAVRKRLRPLVELTGEPTDEIGALRDRVAARALPETVRISLTREIDRLERMSEQSPEHGWVRTWIDTMLESAVGRASPTTTRRGRGAGRARRRPLRAGRGEGPHRRVPGRPPPPCRPAAARPVRPVQPSTGQPVDSTGNVRALRGDGAIVALVGPPGCGQDLARRVGRSGHGTAVRSGGAGWRPRRGRDPGSSTHLRRGSARAASPGRSPRPAR